MKPSNLCIHTSFWSSLILLRSSCTFHFINNNFPVHEKCQIKKLHLYKKPFIRIPPPNFMPDITSESQPLPVEPKPKYTRTCRLSPIFRLADRRNAFVPGACDLQPVRMNRQRTSGWWVTQSQDISRTDPAICRDLPAFHRRGGRSTNTEAREYLHTFDRSITFAREITCNGCHGRCAFFFLFI